MRRRVGAAFAAAGAGVDASGEKEEAKGAGGNSSSQQSLGLEIDNLTRDLVRAVAQRAWVLVCETVAVVELVGAAGLVVMLYCLGTSLLMGRLARNAARDVLRRVEVVKRVIIR